MPLKHMFWNLYVTYVQLLKTSTLFQTAPFSEPIRSFSTILDALESSHRALFKTSRIFETFAIGAENEPI